MYNKDYVRRMQNVSSMYNRVTSELCDRVQFMDKLSDYCPLLVSNAIIKNIKSFQDDIYDYIFKGNKFSMQDIYSMIYDIIEKSYNELVGMNAREETFKTPTVFYDLLLQTIIQDITNYADSKSLQYADYGIVIEILENAREQVLI